MPALTSPARSPACSFPPGSSLGKKPKLKANSTWCAACSCQGAWGCAPWDRCCSSPRRLGCAVVTMLHWRRRSGGFCLINIKPASSPPPTNPPPPSLFLVVVGEVMHQHLLAVRPFFGSLWSICSLLVHTQTVHPLCVLTRSLQHRMLRQAPTLGYSRASFGSWHHSKCDAHSCVLVKSETKGQAQLRGVKPFP